MLLDLKPKRDEYIAFILKFSVGQGGVYVCGDVEQGVTTLLSTIKRRAGDSWTQEVSSLQWMRATIKSAISRNTFASEPNPAMLSSACL